jgi:hypothetical protein
MRIFLLNEATGCVYIRNGRADSWKQLFGSERDTIISRILLLALTTFLFIKSTARKKSEVERAVGSPVDQKEGSSGI